MKNITIKIAKTEEEFLSAYQLRYKVFTEEEGDYRYADTERKIFKDETDTNDHIIFLVYHKDVLIGTSKIGLRKFSPFPRDDFYEFDIIADRHHESIEFIKNKSVLWQRIVIKKEYRNQGIGKKLLKEMFDKSKELKMKYIFVAFKPNSKKIKYWKEWGFHFYKEKQILDGYLLKVMYQTI